MVRTSKPPGRRSVQPHTPTTTPAHTSFPYDAGACSQLKSSRCAGLAGLLVSYVSFVGETLKSSTLPRAVVGVPRWERWLWLWWWWWCVAAAACAGLGVTLRNSERLKPAPTGVLTALLPRIGGGDEYSSARVDVRFGRAGEGEVARKSSRSAPSSESLKLGCPLRRECAAGGGVDGAKGGVMARLWVLVKTGRALAEMIQVLEHLHPRCPPGSA